MSGGKGSGKSSRKAARSGSAPGKVTIFDVAREAGVSIKTVSRVVNREPNVREDTRKKVAAAVAKLDYRPNAAARELSGNRSRVIGLIYENGDEFGYLKHIMDAALEACDAEGYTLLLRPLTLQREDVLEQIRTFAVQARLDGVILPAPIADLDGVTRLFRELGVPIAAITPRSPKADSINVFCDDAQAVHALTIFLIEQGHRHIGFIKGHPDHRASTERFRGYREALKERGIPYRSALVRQGYFSFESGRAAAARLLALEERPSAIIASNDDMAVGVMFEAREQGLEVPDDLSVVGFDDTPVAAHSWPPLTTGRQPIEALAQTATRKLLQKLRGEPDTVVDEPFRCEVIIRSSTAPCETA